jgi:hypothetical protein
MEFTFTQHALSRAIDMALDTDEITLCLRSPEMTTPDDKGACVYYVRDRITCVVDFKVKEVVTIVWRRDDMIHKGFGPRTARFNR